MSVDNKKLKTRPRITEMSVSDGKSITLYWTKVPGADKYAVKRSVEPDGEYETVKWTKKTDFTDINVKRDITYWYKVVAVKELKRKRQSKKASPVAAEIISDIPAPSELTATPHNGAVIRLSWKSPGGKCRFIINRRNDFFNQIIPVGTVDKTKFIDKDVIPGQVYHYSVQSLINGENGAQEGNFSQEVSCVCLDCGEIIKAKSGVFKRVFVQVRIVAGADGYILERSDDGESFKEVAKTDCGTDIRFTDKSGRMFRSYYYRAKAYKVIDGKEFVSEASPMIKVRTL